MNKINGTKLVHMTQSSGIDDDFIDSNLKMVNLKLHYDIMLGRFLFNNLPSIKTRSIRLFLCAPFHGIFDLILF
jgi:hypothetical protein